MDLYTEGEVGFKLEVGLVEVKGSFRGRSVTKLKDLNNQN